MIVMSRAISAELKTVSDPAQHKLQRFARDIRQLALGAASEVCPQKILSGHEVRLGSDFSDVIPLGAARDAGN